MDIEKIQNKLCKEVQRLVNRRKTPVSWGKLLAHVSEFSFLKKNVYHVDNLIMLLNDNRVGSVTTFKETCYTMKVVKLKTKEKQHSSSS
uniref:Uncharacterized protein n=1 Tax=Setaria italica TaxID=4555 RepID=K3XNR7_SETIT